MKTPVAVVRQESLFFVDEIEKGTRDRQNSIVEFCLSFCSFWSSYTRKTEIRPTALRIVEELWRGVSPLACESTHEPTHSPPSPQSQLSTPPPSARDLKEGEPVPLSPSSQLDSLTPRFPPSFQSLGSPSLQPLFSARASSTSSLMRWIILLVLVHSAAP